MVRTDTFQQGVEVLTMVRMPQMAEFMEKHIVPELFRKPHQVEVQVDVALSRTATPIGGVVLYPDLVVLE